MITEKRLKELIEKEATIYFYSNDYGIIEEFNLKGCEIYNDFDSTQLVYENEPYDLKNLYETKAEAEFVAEFGNVEKVVKMPVPPTWEEQSKIKGYGYFDIIKLGHLTLKRLLPISKIKGKFFVEKAYSKDFYTFEYTKQGYITALRKIVELWREEV